MFESHALSTGDFLVNIDGNDDVEELVAFTKANPRKQIYLSIGEQLTPEVMEGRLIAGTNHLDVTGLDNLLISYKAQGGYIKRSKRDIPPTPSHNPKAGRYGQTRRMGKHR